MRLVLYALLSSVAPFARAALPGQGLSALKSLRTSTKLLLLCSVFIGALAVVTYSLVAERQIAIHFVRKELVGFDRMESVRGVYVALLTAHPNAFSAAKAAVGRLVNLDLPDSNQSDIASVEHSLAEVIDKLEASPDNEQKGALWVDALIAARNLASRIGDDSNLTVDPDLDSFYVEDVVVVKMPTLLSQIGELHSELEMSSSTPSGSETVVVRALLLDGMIQSTLEGIQRDLQASYRGRSGEQLQKTLDPDLRTIVSAWNTYLNTVKTNFGGSRDSDALNRSYASVVDSAMNAWTASAAELRRLLNARLASLLSKMRGTLLLNGVLAALSVAFAIVTSRYIVQPLLKLEGLADQVGQTKDYKLRSDHESGDEIGRLATAFNVMLAELDAAREREAADAEQRAGMQTELARVGQITTMGELAASIAHEINQPLAAIVNNTNASLRWLGQKPPNVERALCVLKRVVSDGDRASEVIGSIRALLEKGNQTRGQLDVNSLIREVITFVRADLRNHAIAVRIELAEDLPRIFAVRIQLQQVLVNLITNAVESMGTIKDRARVLTVRSQKDEGYGILITVEDTGIGIHQMHFDRIFEAFFSTKPEGMGMGLSICRSILESHGGRITARTGPGGSVFQISLPHDESA